MKKVISLIILLCMVLSAVPIFASDAEGTWRNNTWRLEGNTLYVSNAEGYIFGHTVITNISYKQILAGEYADVIEEVVFEEGATVIEDCLLGLDKVHTVYIPSTATKLYIYCDVNFVVDEENAVYSSLDGVLFNKDKTTLLEYPKRKEDIVFALPESVTKIQASAFNENKHIKTVIFNENLVEICDYAFKECDNLGSISLPDSVKIIGKEAFLSCNSLTSADLGSVEEIGREAFRYTNIKTLTIPKTLKKLGAQAFMYNDALTKLVIEEGVSEIPLQAFAYCESLEDVSLPDSVTKIGSNAFFGTKLKQYDDALYIGEKLLSCTASGSYTVKDGTRFIANGAFSGSSVTYVNLPEGMTYIGEGAFSGAESLESVRMPETITAISIGAFNNTKLKSIYIGKNVHYIAPGVFNNCEYLEEIIVHEDNQYFASVDGVLFNKDKTQIITYPKNKKDAEFTVPEAVGEAGNLNSNTEDNIKPQWEYFTYEESADIVTITGLSENAPLNIVVPGEINGKKVILAEGAFSSGKMESVIIEDGITIIPQKCFYNCDNLKSVILPDSVTTLGYLAFANSGIEEIKLPEFVENSGYSTFFECSNLKRVDLNNVKSVGLFSFRYCDSLETVTHSGNLTGIADFAFAGCSSLKNIDLSTVESFGKNVFRGCGSLSFVNLQSLKEWEGFYSDDIDEESMMLKSTGFYSHHTYSDPIGYKALLLGTSIDTVRIKFPETEDKELGAIFINSNVENVVFDNFPENINKWEFYSAKSIDTSMNRKVKLEKKDKDFIIYGKDNRVREYAKMAGAEYRELIDIIVNGNILYSDTLPYIKNDRTMVPMRAIFEALGAEVSWDNETRTAIGVKGNVEVKITIGENILCKNGEAIELDCAAEITNDRTMVPVRAISEAFGCSVEWDNDTKTVEITH